MVSRGQTCTTGIVSDCTCSPRRMVIPTLLCLAVFSGETFDSTVSSSSTPSSSALPKAADLLGALDRLDSRRQECLCLDRDVARHGVPGGVRLLFATLLLRVFGDGGLFYLLPITAAATDVFENVSVALLGSTYDGAPTS